MVHGILARRRGWGVWGVHCHDRPLPAALRGLPLCVWGRAINAPTRVYRDAGDYLSVQLRLKPPRSTLHTTSSLCRTWNREAQHRIAGISKQRENYGPMGAHENSFYGPSNTRRSFRKSQSSVVIVRNEVTSNCGSFEAMYPIAPSLRAVKC